MDNIIIKKIWADSDFYEVEIKFKTEFMQCKKISYLVNSDIENLIRGIVDYINENTDFIWEIGENNSSRSPQIIIKSMGVNINGYVTLEIFCNVFTEVNNKYGCFFPLETEIGSLQRFAKELSKLNVDEIGTTIELI